MTTVPDARVLILGADDVEDMELLDARTPADLGPWMRALLAALA